jgi:hypothetical protein
MSVFTIWRGAISSPPSSSLAITSPRRKYIYICTCVYHKSYTILSIFVLNSA